MTQPSLSPHPHCRAPCSRASTVDPLPHSSKSQAFSGSLKIDFGGAFRHRDLTSGESSALTQTVEVWTLLELIALALLAPAPHSRCTLGEKGRHRED
eukprot:3941135-Rhodomonas_salina.4